MTEQEAFNDPEMKTIILLSGYVRELGNGKDYETTTYKLAETLVKVFSIHRVSQQRELLLLAWKASASYYQAPNVGKEAPDFDEWYKSNCG